MSEQDGGQLVALQRPADNDRETWREYWIQQGCWWRTEPEIDEERQKYLAHRRSIKPDIMQNIYPFKDIKLDRADVEWLLATHENGRGPVDWSDEGQRVRWGLDLRGADLSQVDLFRLPLTRLIGGLMLGEWENATEEQRSAAAILLKGSNLKVTRLQGAVLRKARLDGANLFRTYLERAQLDGAYLGRTSLIETYLEKVSLVKITFGDEERVGPQVVDAHWSDSNLAAVQWSQVDMLGDEYIARQLKHNGEMKDNTTRMEEYEVAVRANRQLAIALQSQGLNEDATRFAYRAQLMQQRLFWYQKKFGQYLFSLFLDLLSGYGYKPIRSFIAYLIVIAAFATTYFIIGHTSGPRLSPLGSVVFSMTSFHGRGFFPGGIGLDDPLTVVAAFEAFIGLLIEVTFIATLTQRLFGK